MARLEAGEGAAEAPAARLPIHYVVLIGAQFAVGAAALMARAGLDVGMTPLALSAWRLTVASLVLVPILHVAARRHNARGTRALHQAVPRNQRAVSLSRMNQRAVHGSADAAVDSRIRARMVAAGVCLGLHFATWFASLQVIPVARSTLLVTTAPVWAGVGGVVFLHHRLPRAFWAGLAVAAVGVALVTQGAGPGASHPHTSGLSVLLGDALAILGAVLVAAYLLLVQDLQTRLGTWRVVAWTYTAAAVSLWPLVFVSHGVVGSLPVSAPAWLSIVGMAVLPQLLGHTALNWSLKVFPAGMVAAATLLEPVFAGALAWVLLGEALSGRQLIGAAVLLSGVALAILRKES